jgi:ribonuclease D
MPRLKPPSKEESQLLPDYAALPDSAIHVPVTAADFAQARTQLLAQSALGFDTESKPLFHIHQIDTGPHVVQLATPQAAWLLQLHHPQALALAREIISHAGICKVGFGLDNDKSSLPKRLGVELAHIVDLDRVFKRYGYGASTGVRAAIALVLGQSFHKSKKQSTSNWSLPTLSPAQIRYAANDAHGPAMVYAALPAWEAQQAQAPVPQPQRPPRAAQPPRTHETAHTPRPSHPPRAALFQAPKKPSN